MFHICIQSIIKTSWDKLSHDPTFHVYEDDNDGSFKIVR